MSKFHVGQKVVCIDDADQSSKGRKDVFAGQVYEISWVGSYTHPFFRNTATAIRLVGVNRWCATCCADVPLRASRFRPAVTRKTDISIFKSMLNKPTVRVPA